MSNASIVPGIAICGAAGSGKSTTASMLSDLDWGRSNFRRLSFASALKDEVAKACATNPDEAARFRQEMDNPTHKGYWRTILQWWGTELRRDRFGVNYWVNRLLDELAWYSREWPYTIIVVDDCRFKNEYQALKAKGFLFVLLDPPPTELRKQLSADQALHPSEQEWRSFQFDLHLPWETPSMRVATIMGYMTNKLVANS